MDIRGTTAIVTGASSGIGAATAEALAGAGADVVLVARREQRLEEVATRCRAAGVRALVHAADLSDRDACRGVVAAATGQLGEVDVLINNAGIPSRLHVTELDPDDVDRVMTVNFAAPMVLTLAVLPGMLERGSGAIVNVTSVSAHIPVPRAAAYGASKAALSRWSHGLAVDLAGTGVTASEVSPGPIATEIWDRGEREHPYEGRTYPPGLVADHILAAVRRGDAQRTAPRTYGTLGSLYGLPGVGRALRFGLARFWPAPGE